MSDIEHARMMLELAKKDFKALGGMIDAEVFDDSIFGFHVQQTAEKAIKAWLSFLGVKYPKTHDLRHLLTLLDGRGVSTEALFELVEYNAYAVQFRYESFLADEGPIDRKEALSLAGSLIERVEGVLK
ncbi:MAG: HEPN domain-containing protein [Nitrospinae bacterium]|nr:HEPN domain-containing protein [Nitrospinota bacterium]MBF0633807.1 HEPN domain-containing protein [Nitrospinota bacterium]